MVRVIRHRFVTFPVVVLIALLTACGSDDKPRADGTTSPTANSALAGTYSCGGDPAEPAAVNTLELRSDGTLTISNPSFVNRRGETIPPKTADGMWSVSGNTVTVVGSFTAEIPGGFKYTVEGNRLVTDGGPVCTKSN